MTKRVYDPTVNNLALRIITFIMQLHDELKTKRLSRLSSRKINKPLLANFLCNRRRIFLHGFTTLRGVHIAVTLHH